MTISQDCDGVVDLGIIGENVLEEEELGRLAAGETIAYKKLRQLDFGGCRLSLAIDRDQTYNGVQTLANQRIATSYPHLLRRDMQQQGVPFKNCLLNGSVEVAPSAGLAAAICEIRPQTGRQRYDLAQCKRITAFTEFSTFR